MHIYNTLTEKKEILEKPKKGPLKLFVCGPTVYDSSHIGHAKTFISFDVIARYIRAQNFKLNYLQNITDVDDKIIERAKKEKKTPQAVARQFEEEFHQDMKLLNVTSVDKYARASEFISAILRQIKNLISKGFAYQTSSGIYFEVRKFKKYGQLSKQNLEELRPGYRIETDPEKRDPLDFALWKISADEPNWPSPWGSGRPGWHIEDTAITEEIFGVQYDLHGGGLDLKFPHHESEIAQQESASGKQPFVKIWLHSGFLLVNGEKMSKSLKNFTTIKDFTKKYSPIVLRYMVVSGHYRSPFNYTDKLAEQTKTTVNNLIKFLTKMNLISKTKNHSLSVFDTHIFEEGFYKAMDDDFNTPEALASIFSLVNKINEQGWNVSATQAKIVKKIIEKHLAILGLDIKPIEIPENIKNLVEQREIFRKKQNFKAADEMRKQIKELGFEVEDTPMGPLVS
ncbi:MAG: cysteine--tRNA ligase [Patescibacteria group bacterium]